MATPKPNTEVEVNECGRRGGESRPHGSLTDHEVRLAVALLAEGVSKRAIAHRLCVSPRTIARVLERPSAAMD